MSTAQSTSFSHGLRLLGWGSALALIGFFLPWWVAPSSDSSYAFSGLLSPLWELLHLSAADQLRPAYVEFLTHLTLAAFILLLAECTQLLATLLTWRHGQATPPGTILRTARFLAALVAWLGILGMAATLFPTKIPLIRVGYPFFNPLPFVGQWLTFVGFILILRGLPRTRPAAPAPAS